MVVVINVHTMHIYMEEFFHIPLERERDIYIYVSLVC
jgi:hypothetical protein